MRERAVKAATEGWRQRPGGGYAGCDGHFCHREKTKIRRRTFGRDGRHRCRICRTMPADRTPQARPHPADVTELLAAMGRGEPSAIDRLMPLVHGELRRVARRQMRREREGHTLQTTALVNEAFL